MNRLTQMCCQNIEKRFTFYMYFKCIARINRCQHLNFILHMTLLNSNTRKRQASICCLTLENTENFKKEKENLCAGYSTPKNTGPRLYLSAITHGFLKYLPYHHLPLFLKTISLQDVCRCHVYIY